MSFLPGLGHQLVWLIHLRLATAEGRANVASQGNECSDGGPVCGKVECLQAHAHLRVHSSIPAGALGPGVEIQDPCTVLLGRRRLGRLPAYTYPGGISQQLALSEALVLCQHCVSGARQHKWERDRHSSLLQSLSTPPCQNWMF